MCTPCTLLYLSDPHILAHGCANGGIVGVEEETCSVLDAVLVDGLEVWVCVYTNPVEGFDERVVGGVNVGSPGVDVADFLEVP